MQIEIGKYYTNKTWKYLLPCLKEYGPVFSTKLSTLYKLAAGIGDGLLVNDSFQNEKLIYVLIDRRYNYKISNNIITYMKYQKQVISDYPYDNAEGGRKHMLVIKIPERYYYAYDRFIEGKYSEMYTAEQLDILYTDNMTHSAIEVLRKTKVAKEKFIENIHISFAVPYDKIVVMPETELDFPLQKAKEMFNHEFITE